MNNTINTVTVKDLSGNTYQVHKTDPRYLSGELKHISKYLATVKDNSGNTSKVSVNDERYLSGELKHLTKYLVTVKDKNNFLFMNICIIFVSSNFKN